MWVVLLGVVTLLLVVYYKRRDSQAKEPPRFLEAGIPDVSDTLAKLGVDMFKGKLNFSLIYEDIYKQYRHHPMVGKKDKWEGEGVALFDMDLIKSVFIKDFDHFTDRRDISMGSKYNENMLSNLNGDKWKRMRRLVSPVFTTGKLRGMVPLIDRVNNLNY